MSSKSILELREYLSSNKEIGTFFKNYANIDEEILLTKAFEIYNKAMNVHQYRCIASFRFLTPRILNNPFYPEVKLFWNNKTIVDIGCGLGTDLRRINFDGAAQNLLYGLDIQNTFINLGYELFNDKDHNNMTFLTGNILENSIIDELNLQEKFDIVYSSSVIHLLDKREISQYLKNIKRITKKGGIFFGQTTGLSEPRCLIDSSSIPRYLHSKGSLQSEFEINGFSNVRINVTEHSHHENSSQNRKMLYFFCNK